MDSELRVFFDDNHDDLKLIPYLLKTSPNGLFLEMSTYEGLERDLLNSRSSDEFLDIYVNKFNKDIAVFPSVKSVIDYVINNKIEFLPFGTHENEMSFNIKHLMRMSFGGVYAFIIGSAYKSFFENELKPLLNNKFEKVTYHS